MFRAIWRALRRPFVEASPYRGTYQVWAEAAAPQRAVVAAILAEYHDDALCDPAHFQQVLACGPYLAFEMPAGSDTYFFATDLAARLEKAGAQVWIEEIPEQRP